jgi:hypothetical protein
LGTTYHCEKKSKDHILLSKLRISDCQVDGQMPGLQLMGFICGGKTGHRVRPEGLQGHFFTANRTGAY